MKTEKIEVNTPFIKLDSFLKLAGAISTGGQAKMLILDSKVSVNGEACLQRGKKLYTGDKVIFDQTEYEVIKGEG